MVKTLRLLVHQTSYIYYRDRNSLKVQNILSETLNILYCLFSYYLLGMESAHYKTELFGSLLGKAFHLNQALGCCTREIWSEVLYHML